MTSPHETRLLQLVDEAIKQFSKENPGRASTETIQRALVHLLQSRLDQQAKEWQDYLSRHDMGPYGGR